MIKSFFLYCLHIHKLSDFKLKTFFGKKKTSNTYVNYTYLEITIPSNFLLN